MTPSAPTEGRKRLFESLKPSYFLRNDYGLSLQARLDLIEKHVFPILDALPNDTRAELVRTILKVRPDYVHQTEKETEMERLRDSLDYEESKFWPYKIDALKKGLALADDEDTVAKKQQVLAITEIARNVLLWLPTLWKAGAQHGILDPDRVLGCLGQCKDAIDQLREAVKGSEHQFEKLKFGHLGLEAYENVDCTASDIISAIGVILRDTVVTVWEASHEEDMVDMVESMLKSVEEMGMMEVIEALPARDRGLSDANLTGDFFIGIRAAVAAGELATLERPMVDESQRGQRVRLKRKRESSDEEETSSEEPDRKRQHT